METSVWLLGATIVLAVIIIIGTLRAPNAPGRYAFALSVLMSLWWTSCVLYRHSVTDFEQQLVATKLAWFGIMGTPLYWSLSFVTYARGRQPETLGQIVVIGLVSAFFGIIALTDSWHHAMYLELLDAEAMLFRHGWAYWAALGIAYSTMTVACITGTVLTIRHRSIHRWQILSLLIAALVPWVANVAYTQYGFMLFNDDPTPFVFVGAGAFMLGAQFLGRLFVVPPIGREAIFAILPDPVIILDESGRILELNPAAATLPGLPAHPIGALLREPAELSALLARTAHGDGERHELTLTGNGNAYEVSTHSLKPWGRAGGRMIVMRDISLRKADQNRLASLSRDLEARLRDNLRLQEMLREEALRDHLTGLYNRRHAQNILPDLLAKQTSGGVSALAILDIDHFKSFNDRFGHQVGDEVLKAFAATLLAALGPGDSLFRWGGEEFLIHLDSTSRTEILACCERWRAVLQDIQIPGLTHPGLTFSAGIFLCPASGASLEAAVKAADQALYGAKAAGRDCCRIAGESRPAPCPSASGTARKGIASLA
ncbi:GGDEF domain-containing protein [Rhizobium straminoryzae]|uniref:diguanylate cyclase n=1 Tax=Rhizobium straminoryzae TaxID=1387186 RepID=A0A549T330_9HYPH|nr:diguanylate cyclase [Rhizobium straminoryzae]TRL36271.1 diguanylate cyclase [Rhizobium straminoryzae]